MDAPNFNSLFAYVCFEASCLVRRNRRYIFKHVKMAQVSFDKSVEYLDIAVEPCRRTWKKDMKFKIIQKISLTCADYFVHESEIPPSGSIIFQEVDMIEKAQLRFIETKRAIDVNICYKEFTSVFLKRFESLDQTQRRTYCRSLLRIHRILKIRDFDEFGLRTLILEATCPEPDPELTVEILRVIGTSPFMIFQSFYNAPYRALKTMLSNAKSMGFDFWGLWRGVGDMSTKHNLIASLMTSDRKMHIIILLQHGFPFLCSSYIYETRCFKFIESRCSAKVHFIHDCFCELMDKPNKERMMLILTTYIAVSESMKEETLPDDTVATLKCLMRSLPDPYVLPSEMCNELKPLFRAVSTDYIESVCRKYQECDFFSEDYTVYKPRKLKHLCRCAIRKILAAFWRLPEGIYQLGMPSQITKYLSLDS